MDPENFDQVAAVLAARGPAAAAAELVESFRERRQFHRVFDALLLQSRCDLGLPLVHPRSTDLAPALREVYESRVMDACRTVGALFLADGDLPSAFQYYHMIGEVEPIHDALDKFKPMDGEAVEPLVDIALSQGVHPARGLGWVLEKYGLCQAITACEQALNQNLKPAVRDACVKLLVKSLHEELSSRLSAEIAAKEGTAPPAALNLPPLWKTREWLFAEDNYHVDTSHLNSIVRFARLLPKCDELFLAIQLCEYGLRLSERYRYPESPPFENLYADSAIYFCGVVGLEIEKALEHFKRKADEAGEDETAAYAKDMYAQLLARAGRVDQAVQYVGKTLNLPPNSGVPCAQVDDLCQTHGRFTDMAKFARQRGDLATYAAALMEQNRLDRLKAAKTTV
ncbi:MAG: hypothetical protein ACRDD1_14530 [Planctomycetia bacterium]